MTTKRDAEPRQIDTNCWRNWAIGFGIWTIVGLSFASRSYLQYQFNGTNVSWQEVYAGYMIDFYLWAIASPFIFWLNRRFPIERKRLTHRLIFHLFAALLLNFVVCALASPMLWHFGFTNKTRFPTLEAFFIFSISSPVLLHQGLLVYSGTLIVAHVFDYYRQVQIGKTRAIELASQLAQAQLTALKMQIHPHFLFNTLNSIAALLHKDVEAADRMLARLSDFLRITLKSSETSVVTLAQELEFLRTYLEIEKIRFQDKLVIEMKIAPDALAAQVPNLILQPLVENAVRHGISKQIAVGHLYINAQRKANRLLIQIEDNGPGLKTGNGHSNKKLDNGVGIANTRARLEQFYDNFQFEIADRKNHDGTIVNLNVPYLI